LSDALQPLRAGDSMPEVGELIARVADTDVTVLIRGERGTGKERVARAIHEASNRRQKTFVRIHCSALPIELLEAELFGFERGAFPGAVQQKPGKFEFAHEGTMFLDEIGDLHPTLQLKLLQLLQDGGFARLGGHRELRVDVRLVAATARDLECAVADGRFREDLFFRLNVICITLPPLRHRRDHIPQVAERLLEEYARLYNRPQVRLSEHTLGLLRTHEWPGNLRELETLLKRAAATGSEDSIRTLLAATIDARTRKPGPIPALHRSAFEPSVTAPASGRDAQSVAAHLAAPLSGSLKDIARSAAREAERDLIYRTLQQTRWNRREAAEILGVSYKALLYKIKEADLGRAS